MDNAVSGCGVHSLGAFGQIIIHCFLFCSFFLLAAGRRGRKNVSGLQNLLAQPATGFITHLYPHDECALFLSKTSGIEKRLLINDGFFQRKAKRNSLIKRSRKK